jgi:DNA invertase Pin-like site-specific DNA recombinase
MKAPTSLRRCAIYTRKSTEEGLEQAFNSLDAQRDAGIAYIQSQAAEGWHLVETPYDDGGFSGATLERPALQQLLTDIRTGRIHVVVVYKVDRLTRSLGDFAQLIDLFDQHEVAFASVTQQFQTTTSMGRLVLNVLLSFAQFEREVTGERIRDKIAASKKKGWWMGGVPPLGYDVKDRQLIINEGEAQLVQQIFQRYGAVKSVSALVRVLRQEGLRTKVYRSRAGRMSGGRPFSRGHLYHLLHNRIYRGEIVHRHDAYPGQHPAIIDEDLWQQTQAILAANHRAWHQDTHVRTPFLLKGCLFDDEGNRFSPMQGKKEGRVYRYYVNQVVLQVQDASPQLIRRLPADSLEQAVLQAVREVMSRAEDTHAWLQRVYAQPERDQQTFWQDLLTRVEVGTQRLRIAFHPPGRINNEQAGMDEGPVRVVDVAWRMTRVQGRADLQVQGTPVPTPQAPHAGLVEVVRRAFHWRAEMLDGHMSTIKALAQREGLTRRYVMRVLRLSFLAPDIIEAILQGRQPAHFTLESFRRPIPLEWAAQRQYFGFPPGSCSGTAEKETPA